MNPFNPDAGATPFPVDPLVVAVVNRAATVIWRAFPYVGWRFQARGRAFGRSDAGYLTTLVALPPLMQGSQLDWLARVLSPRGMPSLLIEVQLELLARVGYRAGWAAAGVMRGMAAHLGANRQRIISDEHLRNCDRHFLARTVSVGSPRRSIGVLIAAEVVDLRLGYLQRVDATLGWLLSHGPDDPRWRLACVETRALAEDAAARSS